MYCTAPQLPLRLVFIAAAAAAERAGTAVLWRLQYQVCVQSACLGFNTFFQLSKYH